MKTKIVAVWHVEYVFCGSPVVNVAASYDEALEVQHALRDARDCALVTITGPHQHRVSA